MYSNCLKLGLKKYIQKTEISMIEKSLCETGGNISKAARLLKLNRTTLVMKMKALGIKKDWLSEAKEGV